MSEGVRREAAAVAATGKEVLIAVVHGHAAAAVPWQSTEELFLQPFTHLQEVATKVMSHQHKLLRLAAQLLLLMLQGGLHDAHQACCSLAAALAAA